MSKADELVEVAARHPMGTSELKDPNLELAFSESYAPYVPDPWNGVLVLAESQNLSDPEDWYYAKLKEQSPRMRMNRMPLKPGHVGVHPWDNGNMKLMISCINTSWNVNEVAVSNAVPWSCRTKNRQNVNPTPAMKEKASAFWREMIPALGPKLGVIVAFGTVARDVLSKSKEASGWDGQLHFLRLPAPQAMNYSASMFDRDDMVRRFPEINEACATLGVSSGDLTAGQILFACHAASIGSRLSLSTNSNR